MSGFSGPSLPFIKTYLEGVPSLNLAGTLGLLQAYGSGPHIDYSGQPSSTLVNNGTTTIWTTASYGKILIAEFGTVGDMAEYQLGAGIVTLQTSAAGFFVASTSSPAAGKASIYVSAGNVILVNKAGATITYRVALNKLV